MRLVYLGSPEPAIGPLKALAERAMLYGHDLVGVVSQPARPSGRKQVLRDPPVAQFAKQLGIPVLQPERASDPLFLQEFKNLSPDIAITAAYGQILTNEFLSIPRRATINIHPSLLPKYRGATPVPAAILAGDHESGVSILFTVQKLDAGAIICQEKTPIKPNELAGELTFRYFNLGADLLFRALDKLQDPAFVGSPQDESKVSHCRKIEKKDGLIDWAHTATNIYNRFRAYHPWPGTYTFLEGRRIQIIEMHLPIGQSKPTTAKLGSAYFDKSLECITVQTAEGLILIQKIKPAGGSEVSALSFWNGIKDRIEVIFSSHE